jgi:hypothetical protein
MGDWILGLFKNAVSTTEVIENQLPFRVTSHVPDQKWSPQLEDRGYDNVLPDQSYLTPQESVIDECGAMMKWWLAGENQRNSENNWLHCHFVYHKPHMKSPGALLWEAST